MITMCPTYTHFQGVNNGFHRQSSPNFCPTPQTGSQIDNNERERPPCGFISIVLVTLLFGHFVSLYFLTTLENVIAENLKSLCYFFLAFWQWQHCHNLTMTLLKTLCRPSISCCGKFTADLLTFGALIWKFKTAQLCQFTFLRVI